MVKLTVTRMVGCLALLVLAAWTAAGEPGEQKGNVSGVNQETLPQPRVPPAEAPRPTPSGAETPAGPQAFDPLAPSFRLPLLPGAPGGLGGTPKPSPEVLKAYSQFVEQTIDPQNVLDVIIGRPRLLVFKDIPALVSIAPDEKDPAAIVTRVSQIPDRFPNQFFVVGKRVGTTVLDLWFPDPQDPKKFKILSYLVRVIPDPEAKERLEKVYKALADEINRAFPDSVVCLTLVGDKLVVSGQAKDVAEATQILRIVQANAPRGAQQQQPQGAVARIPVSPETVTTTTSEVGLTGVTSQSLQQSIENYVLGGVTTGNVINLLRVPGEQQVMLKVVVAEVNRSAARSIGINFDVLNNQGLTVFRNVTGNIAGSTTGGTGVASGITSGVGSAANLTALLNNGKLALAINALQSLDLARSLAEPNLTALNGQPASFRAGGEFPVPVVTGATSAGLEGVSFVPFGVQVSFTPLITDKNRIRLSVTADVSTRDNATSASVGGTIVPSLNTRNFQTTVELREGETLAVAGLIQNNFASDATRVPFFGDLPVVGRFFAFDRTSNADQELIILVTPELVHPLDPKELPPLPGSDMFEPGDVEFYLLGRLESRRLEDYRSPVRTDIPRKLRYHCCQDIYITGPQGHSDGH